MRSQAMRVAIVTETYPPEINGVALTVAGLAHGLRRTGHKVQVIRPRQPHADREAPAVDDVLVPGMRLPRYPGLRMGLPARRRLLALWRNTLPDALYVATEGPLGDSALAVARRLGIPACTGFHTRFDEFARCYGLGWLRPLVRGYLRYFHRRALATLVPTNELAAWLREQGFGHVTLLRRAVDTQLFSPIRRDPALRARWGVSDDRLAVIHVGRIAAEKNLALAVRAFRAIQVRCPDARFIWVGDGPRRAALQAQNPDFVFCGVQYGEALAAHYASADLLSPRSLHSMSLVFRLGTHSTRSTSPSWRWPTFPYSPRCWCRLRYSLPHRAWCSACTIPAMCSPGRNRAVQFPAAAWPFIK